jgi:HK97 family phage portal protein
MGLFDVFKRQKGLDPLQNISNNALKQINGAVLQNYQSKSYVDEGYLGNADVYSIVSFLARKAASVPWYVYKLNKGEKAKTSLLRYKQLSKGLANKGAFERAMIERKNAYSDNIVMDSDLAKLLENPNQYQAQDQFLENLFGYRILSGEGNIYGNNGNIPGAKFLELNVLPTQFLDIYPDPRDLYGLLGYKLMVSQSIDIPKDQVCAWKSWNPDFNDVTRSHMRGLSPLRSAYSTLRMSNNAHDASAAMTANGGAKGAIVPKPIGSNVAQFTIEQANIIKRAVNDDLNGIDNKGAIRVLQTPWDYLNFGLSSVDMELMGTLKMSLQQWCRVFGLPQVLFDTDTTSYNNYQNALRDMMTNTIIPLCSTLRDELNRWLLPIYGEDVYIDFDITSIPEMQQDMERMTRVLRDANWLTMDEKRIAMNYEPKYGAYEYSYVNQGLVVLDQVAMDLTYDDTNGSDNLDSSDDTISQDIEREELSSGERYDEQGS